MWFIKAGQTAQDAKYPTSILSSLDGAWDWKITAHLKGHSRYPEVIHDSAMWPALTAKQAEAGSAARTDCPVDKHRHMDFVWACL